MLTQSPCPNRCQELLTKPGSPWVWLQGVRAPALVPVPLPGGGSVWPHAAACAQLRSWASAQMNYE